MNTVDLVAQIFQTRTGAPASLRARYAGLQDRLLYGVALLEALPADDFRAAQVRAKLDEIAEAFDAEASAQGFEGPSARDVLLTLLPLDPDDPRFDELARLKLELPELERTTTTRDPWVQVAGPQQSSETLQ